MLRSIQNVSSYSKYNIRFSTVSIYNTACFLFLIKLRFLFRKTGSIEIPLISQEKNHTRQKKNPTLLSREICCLKIVRLDRFDESKKSLCALSNLSLHITHALENKCTWKTAIREKKKLKLLHVIWKLVAGSSIYSSLN